MGGRLGRNDPCWCGSGEKFKKCHLNRDSERPLPFAAISNAMWTAWQHKKCFHPQASAAVCDKIVSAHTIQRSRGLERLVDSSNHVYTFHSRKQEEDIRVQRVGWREASTFTGFCSQHDGLTFGPLETTVFTGTEEQCFLIAYRAVCHVYFRGDLCMLSTGVVSPNRDLNRRELQALHDVSAKQESMPFGVVAMPDGGAVVLMWPEGQNAPRLFLSPCLAEVSDVSRVSSSNLYSRM